MGPISASASRRASRRSRSIRSPSSAVGTAAQCTDRGSLGACGGYRDGVRIAFGTDESTSVTEHIVARLRGLGHEVDVVADPAPWPEVGHRVGRQVATGGDDCGI